MATQPLPGKITFGEYLELERVAADCKHEYRGGEMFAMSGRTPVHARLSVRVSSLLDRTMGSGCQIFSSDLRIYASCVSEAMYPDVSMVCGDLEYFDERRDVIVNPTLIVEVLSPSTREYELSLKASFYRTIPALQTILLADSERQYVQRQARQSQGWALEEFTRPDQALWVVDGGSITVADLYNGIDLTQ